MSIVKLTLSSKLAAFICQRTDFFREVIYQIKRNIFKFSRDYVPEANFNFMNLDQKWFVNLD